MACQCVEVIALAVWVGGLVSIVAAVIPAVFNSPIGMETGGRLLTRTFHRYDQLVLMAAGVMVLGMLARGAIAADPIGRPEVVVAAIMVTIAIGLPFYLNPEVVRLQEAAFAAKDAEAKQAAYDVFFAYHWVARGLYLLNLGLGIAMLCLKVWKWAR